MIKNSAYLSLSEAEIFNHLTVTGLKDAYGLYASNYASQDWHGKRQKERIYGYRSTNI